MAAAHPVATMPAYSINFIDENKTRSVLLALFEHIANSTGTNSDEHFHKVGTADAEKGNTSFPGNRPREESFTSSRRTDH